MLVLAVRQIHPTVEESQQRWSASAFQPIRLAVHGEAERHQHVFFVDIVDQQIQLDRCNRLAEQHIGNRLQDRALAGAIATVVIRGVTVLAQHQGEFGLIEINSLRHVAYGQEIPQG